MIHGTQRYRGNTFGVHMKLKFEPAAFEHWIVAFESAANEALEPDDAAKATRIARHMAQSFKVGLFPFAGPDGKLNKLQQAFQNHHALQCGFCTPGILMSFTDYLARNPKPTEDELREVLSGHICRCTGYAGIMAALKEAAGIP